MKKNIFIIFFCIVFSESKSQIVPADTSSIKTLNLKEEVAPSDRNKSNYANVIRFGIAELGRGILSIAYEREIVNHLSATIQFGYTFFDIGGELWNASLASSSDDYISVTSSEGTFKVKGGSSFLFGLRVYPFDRGNLEGFFIEPHFHSKKWKYEQSYNDEFYDPVTQSYYNQETYFSVRPKEIDLGVKFGWQFSTHGSRFYFNPYTGVVYRTRERQGIYFAHGDLSKDDAGHYSNEYKKVAEKKSSPAILLGFNIGVAF